MRVAVKNHALPVYKKNRLASLLCIFESTIHATYLYTVSVIKSWDSHDLLIQTCYQSASSRVTETTFFYQKCFSVENLIIVSLNTAIPIIVIVKLTKFTFLP